MVLKKSGLSRSGLPRFSPVYKKTFRKQAKRLGIKGIKYMITS